jgi:pimeloyl-ACP methyl ester carboxylesterase
MQRSEFVDVNGVRMYYEVSGSGDPIVLLHGGFGGAHVFGGQVPAFAATHRVFVPEMRGRGHTADVAGPITYPLMTDDVTEFLEMVVKGPAHLVGVSDGGIIGLLLAGKRPDLIGRLVVVGSNFHGDGLLAAEMWTTGSPDDAFWEGPRRHHGEVSPDGPEHFPVVFAKLQEMWRNGQPTLGTDDLNGIAVPVLVVAGDDDVVDHHHTVDMFEALRFGQLAVIPGSSHAVFMEKPDLLNRIVLDFLAEDGEPDTMLPVRRAAAPTET